MGLSPFQYQATTWSSANRCSVGLLLVHFNETPTKIMHENVFENVFSKIVTILLTHQSNKVLDVKGTWDNWYWRVVIVYQYLETSVHVCCNVMTYGRSLWTTIYVSSLNCFIAPTSPQNKTKQKQTKQKNPNKFKIYHYISLLLIMDIMHSCHRYVEVYVICRLNWIHCGSQSLYISVDFLLNDPRNGSYIYHCPYNWGLNN